MRSLEPRERPHIPLISKMYSVNQKHDPRYEVNLKKKLGTGRPTTDGNSLDPSNRRTSPPYETSNVLTSHEAITSLGLPQLRDIYKGQQIPKSQHMVTRVAANRNQKNNNIHQIPGSMSTVSKG